MRDSLKSIEIGKMVMKKLHLGLKNIHCHLEQKNKIVSRHMAKN